MNLQYYMCDDESVVTGTKLIAEGDNEMGFYDCLEEVKEHTIHKVRPMTDLGVYVFCTNQDEEGVIKAYDFRPGKAVFRTKKGSISIQVKRAKRTMLEKVLGGAEYLEYALSKGYVFYTAQREYFMPSDGAFPSICERANMTSMRLGKKLPAENTVGAFVDLMTGLNQYTKKDDEFTPKDLTIMYRHNEHAKKAIAFLSDKYTVIDCLKKTIEEFGKIDKLKCEGWTWSQRLTTVTLSFENKSDEISGYLTKIASAGGKDINTKGMVPVIRLCTADTGDCSFTVIGGFVIGNSFVVVEELKKRHVGNADVEKLSTEVRKSIYDTFAQLPERLLDLLLIDIKASDVSDVIENAMEISGIKAELSGRRYKELTDILISEHEVPGMKYNAYDVAMALLEIPGRIERIKSRHKRLAIQKCCYKGIFKDFWKTMPITLSDE